MDYDTFAAQWLGRRIDYDHVYNYQCVDLILEGLHDIYGIASGVSGNAIDYWNNPSAPLLARFDKVASTDVQKGDIVILNGLPGNPDGHIGWGTGNVNGTDIEILEQNGQSGDGDGGNPQLTGNPPLTDGNQIRTRYIPKVRIAGLLRAKPAVPAKPFDVTVITPKTIQLIHDAELWDLNQPDFNSMNAHPAGTYPANYQETVQAAAHHADGYTYYLVTPDSTTGFNTLDCEDYVPPPIPQPAPIPAPVPAALPAAPQSFPAAAVPFQVTKAILGYASVTAALNHSGSTVNIAAGAYYQFRKDPTGMVNVTRTVGTPGSWINPDDMGEAPVAPPEPATPPNWRSTLDTSKAGQYICIVSTGINVFDLEGKRPTKKLQYLDVFESTGEFTFTDGRKYERPINSAGNAFWYGVPPNAVKPYKEWYAETYDTTTNTATRKTTQTLTPRDYLVLATAEVEKIIAPARAKVMDIFVRKKK